MTGIDETNFAAVNEAAVALCTRGVVLGETGFSAGRWTPAVSDGYEWAVLNLQGSPLYLCYDAFEAARHFCQLESGEMTEPDPEYAPVRAWSDEKREEERQWEAWMYEYRFSNIGGYGKGRAA